jgi:uncharacterized protein (DUF1330 family)
MTKMKFALAVVLVAAAVAGAAAFQGTKKGYIIAQVDVTNPQQYGEYTKLTPGLIEKAGGRFVARGGRTTTLEGPEAKGRIVIIEFPSFERAQEFYNSPEYVAARKLRAGAATAQFVLVEGF